jgi:glycosyl transferase family 1
VLHFESAHPVFPIGLERCEIPTVCFHPDTYAFTERRIRWSAVFDHVAVFHPGFEEKFARAGHRGAFLLPHAVRSDVFSGPEMAREFEIGWVGQTSGKFYRARERWLPELARHFKTNDWFRSYSIAEVAEVYRRSRIVVNIGRDDFARDANLRTFEVLAAGALLITSLPSELTALGLRESQHFVGYHHPGEIKELVAKYLREKGEAERISGAARRLVLAEHTYDNRVDRLLQLLKSTPGKHLAPARAWPEARARLAALDFFSAHGLARCANRQFPHVAGRGFRETIQAASLVFRAWLNALRSG